MKLNHDGSRWGCVVTCYAIPHFCTTRTIKKSLWTPIYFLYCCVMILSMFFYYQFLFPLPPSHFFMHICKEDPLASRLSSLELAKKLVRTKAVVLCCTFNFFRLWKQTLSMSSIDSTLNLGYTFSYISQDKPIC